MATFHATFITIQNDSVRGTEHSVPNGHGALGMAALTTSGTAAYVQRGGADFVAPSDGYLLVDCDGNVRVATGEVAAAGASAVGVRVKADGAPYPISIAAGDRISVIDA